MIIIGSKALLPKLEQTEEVEQRFLRADFDVIMSFEQFSNWQQKYNFYITSMYPTQPNKYKVKVEKDGTRSQYEIELAFEGTSAEFLLVNESKVTEGTTVGFFGEEFKTASMPYLMLTKRSHLIYPVHFEKNIADYHTMKDVLGELVRDETMQTYYQLRSDEAKERYSKFKTPNLNVTNEEFFSSKLVVESYFVHDDIHEVMKHHDRPVYEMMKRDFSLAKCEKDMFFSLPQEHQVQAVMEEAYTIALERYIIPQVEGYGDYFAFYKRALMRICTTLCSGWFRSFAIENYDKAVAWYNPGFVAKFKEAFDSGEIKPIDGKKPEDIPAITA